MRSIDGWAGIDARLPFPHGDGPAPDMIALVGRRVRVMQKIAALGIRAELARRRAAQLHARESRVRHLVRMDAVHDFVSEPVDEKRRVLVIVDLAQGLDRWIAFDFLLDELDRDLAVREIADVAVVQRIEMRDVEQVLDEEPVIRRDLDRRTGIAFEVLVDELGRARRTRLAHAVRGARPHPHDAVLLDHRIGFQLGARRNRLLALRGNHHALTVPVVGEAVIGALQVAVRKDFSARERHALVHAAVVERDDLAFGGPPHDDRFLADPVALDLVDLDLVRHAHDIPGVFDERVGDFDRCVVYHGWTSSRRCAGGCVAG